MKEKVKKILKSAYADELVEKLIESFEEVENNYILKKWKSSGLDAGHFVEISRRLIEQELFGSYTDLDKSMSNFNSSELSHYENTTGDVSFRLLIPRILFSIYTIRNKRGVGHTGKVSPNEMDATYIIYSIKWVLAEIIRIKSNLSPDETKKIVNEITERKIHLIWRSGNITRILNPSMQKKDQVLILLLEEQKLSIEALQEAVEYKNKTIFVDKVISELHVKRLINYNKRENICEITPLGSDKAEKIIKTNEKYKS